MAKKFICTLSNDELERAYWVEGRTLREMCEIIGVKNTITAAKILHERGISTNQNEAAAAKTKKGMADQEFANYIKDEYKSGKSMSDIAKEFNVTPSCIRKYFIKYNIDRRKGWEFFQGKPFANPNWRGGKRIVKDGYISIYCPDHPNSGKRKTVYEHQLVMEEYLGRYLYSGEVVHHIDGDKHNNDISNLLLMTESDHMKLHHILENSYERMRKSRCEEKQQT